MTLVEKYDTGKKYSIVILIGRKILKNIAYLLVLYFNHSYSQIIGRPIRKQMLAT